MESDGDLPEASSNADTLFEAEEAELIDTDEPGEQKCSCCYFFESILVRGSPFLLEDRAMQVPITYPTVPEDPRHVRLARTEDLILKCLQDGMGPPITLLHGGSGTGKSTLALDLLRHFVDPIRSTLSGHTSFYFDHVTFLEFGPDVEFDVEKQCLELIRSLDAEEPLPEEGVVDVKGRLKFLLEDKAVLVILDDVWNAKPLEAFMEFKGAKVKYLVTTQIANLWKGSRRKVVEMENISLKDSRKILAAHMGFEGQELPQNLLTVADTIIEQVQGNPLALATVASTLRERIGASEEEWRETSHSLSSVLEASEDNKIQIFDRPYPRGLWASLNLGVQSLDNDVRRLLNFLSLFENTSMPESVLKILFRWYCSRHLMVPAKFRKWGHELQGNGAILKIEVEKSYGAQIRSWTLHSLYRIFIEKQMEKEVELIFRSLTETQKMSDVLENLGLCSEDDMDPEKIISLLCILYLEKRFAEKVIQPSHKSWAWIESCNPRRSAARKLLLLLEDTIEDRKDRNNVAKHVQKVYFSYVCSAELHSVGFVSLLTECGQKVALVTCEALDDMLQSENKVIWNEKIWDIVVAVSGLLRQTQNYYVLPASVVAIASYRFRLDNFARSDPFESVIENLFRAVEEDGCEEVRMLSMIALGNVISIRTAMHVHVPRIVKLLFQKSLLVQTEAARGLSRQTWFQEGRSLLARVLGEEGTTRLLAQLSQETTPPSSEFIRSGMRLLTGVDPTKGDSVRIHSKEVYLGRAEAKADMHMFEEALADFDSAYALDSSAEILRQIAGVKRKKGLFAEALADFDSAYVLDPSDASSWLSERAHAKATLKDFGGALEDFNKAVELQPNDSFFLQERGILKRMMGDYEGALADLNMGLELAPNDYELLKHRGYVKFIMGEEEGAREDAEWAMRIKPLEVDAPTYNDFQSLGYMSVKYLNYELK